HQRDRNDEPGDVHGRVQRHHTRSQERRRDRRQSSRHPHLRLFLEPRTMKGAWLMALVIGCIAAAPSAHADGGARHTHGRASPDPTETPLDALARANEAAREPPVASRFDRARQVYAYEPGAIYQVYANPQYVSVILLEPGENLSSIAAGDTAR